MTITSLERHTRQELTVLADLARMAADREAERAAAQGSKAVRDVHLAAERTYRDLQAKCLRMAAK